MILSSIDVTATTLDVKQSFSILSCSLDPSISFQPCLGRTFPSLPPCIYTYCVWETASGAMRVIRLSHQRSWL